MADAETPSSSKMSQLDRIHGHLHTKLGSIGFGSSTNEVQESLEDRLRGSTIIKEWTENNTFCLKFYLGNGKSEDDFVGAAKTFKEKFHPELDSEDFTVIMSPAELLAKVPEWLDDRVEVREVIKERVS